ncbi:MAG: hypothetical protein Rpha_0784 [Candidatus Ruthia sp. Apha_13_S6]|nr:hypothetical protein [Candidatus Ruthia sp. Apha_13_S6]
MAKKSHFTFYKAALELKPKSLSNKTIPLMPLPFWIAS